jgi:hypothetical protein
MYVVVKLNAISDAVGSVALLERSSALDVAPGCSGLEFGTDAGSSESHLTVESRGDGSATLFMDCGGNGRTNRSSGVSAKTGNTTPSNAASGAIPDFMVGH